jgi:hypothetical protein
MPKKFQVIKATTRDIPGVYVGGREKRFARNGTFTTSDAGEAAEINKVLGMKGTGEVVVTPYKEQEPGHRYTFSGVDTSDFKVWVLKRGKIVRTTKAKAKEKGYTIVADTKKRPGPQQFRNAQATEARNGIQRD